MTDRSSPGLRVELEGFARSAARGVAAGALTGVGVGGFWAGAYALPAPATVALLVTQGLIGAGLGALAGALVRGRAGSPFAAGVVLAVLVALPALQAGPSPGPEPLPPRPLAAFAAAEGTARRVAVIGIDGGDWRVIDPMVAGGELPNLAGLLRRGRSWVLRSIDPSDSPVVWTSIFTGKRPEAHGIQDWETSRADNRRAALLWELAHAAGLRSVVVNVPGSWPPVAVDGALVSGFPIPSPLLPATAATGFQNLGTLLDPERRDAALRVVAPDGSELMLGRAAAHSRLGLRHPRVERLAGRRQLHTRPVTVELRSDAVEPGGWSPWQRDQGLLFRARRLADGRVWVTPAFQDPGHSRLPFTSHPELTPLLADGGPYVVEGAGWRVAAEPALRDALAEHLAQVEAMHLRAAQRLLDAVPDWRVLAHVITLTDRISHPFWRFHDPTDDPVDGPEEQAENRERVRDAYRIADRHLGALLARIQDGRTLVLVASDHGFQASPSEWGGHRDAGILLAAGPGVAPSRQRGERSIFDVTPLALAALGLPVADDMVGAVPEELAAGRDVRRIASYERGGGGAAPRESIDETTAEQLRSLGYVE